MSIGRLIAVVGPSGVGKDSVIAGIADKCPEVIVIRRTITRAPDLAGESYDAAGLETFAQLAEEGAFCLHWSAHGLRYGIPNAALSQVTTGGICLANLSRDVLSEAARVFPSVTVLNLTARPDVLAERLSDRGREDIPGIAKRLAAADRTLPQGLDVVTLENNGELAQTLQVAVAALGLGEAT